MYVIYQYSIKHCSVDSHSVHMHIVILVCPLTQPGRQLYDHHDSHLFCGEEEHRCELEAGPAFCMPSPLHLRFCREHMNHTEPGAYERRFTQLKSSWFYVLSLCTLVSLHVFCLCTVVLIGNTGTGLLYSVCIFGE